MVAALLLAGCNGVFGGPATQTPEPTRTPVGDVAYPPGVTDDGVSDAVELVGAHQRTASGVSFVSNRTVTVRYPNGTRAGLIRTVRHDADTDRYHLRQRTSGPPSRAVPDTEFEVWTNDSVSVGMIREDGENRTFEDPEYLARGASRERLLTLFATREVATTGTTTDGEPLVHLLGTGDAEVTVHRGVENVSETTFSAAVTPEGVIRSYALRYGAELGGETVRVVEEFRLRPAPELTVDRPAWVRSTLRESERSKAV